MFIFKTHENTNEEILNQLTTWTRLEIFESIIWIWKLARRVKLSKLLFFFGNESFKRRESSLVSTVTSTKYYFRLLNFWSNWNYCVQPQCKCFLHFRVKITNIVRKIKLKISKFINPLKLSPSKRPCINLLFIFIYLPCWSFYM